MPYTLHSQLAADTFPVKTLELCEVRLMNNAFYPWLILVPMRGDMKEIINLSPEDRQQLYAEMEQVSVFLQETFQPDKLNIAALGNMVPQLHIHIIVRYQNDAAWPKPVWGQAATPYDAELKAEMLSRLTAL